MQQMVSMLRTMEKSIVVSNEQLSFSVYARKSLICSFYSELNAGFGEMQQKR